MGRTQRNAFHESHFDVKENTLNFLSFDCYRFLGIQASERDHTRCKDIFRLMSVSDLYVGQRIYLKGSKCSRLVRGEGGYSVRLAAILSRLEPDRTRLVAFEEHTC